MAVQLEPAAAPPAEERARLRWKRLRTALDVRSGKKVFVMMPHLAPWMEKAYRKVSSFSGDHANSEPRSRGALSGASPSCSCRSRVCRLRTDESLLPGSCLAMRDHLGPISAIMERTS